MKSSEQPLDGEIVELREFVCVHCQHTVVVHPGLPKDYTPSCCMQCWETVVEPRQKELDQKLFVKTLELMSLLGFKA